MAEKKLVMKFATAGSGQTSMTLSDAKQDLDEVTVKTAMQSMCDSAAFATTKGAAYTAPLAASYVEEVETTLFDESSEAV